jgi:putative ABC transport system permease protein
MHPPKWADKFLQWYCRPDLLEEIQGDTHELYNRKVNESKRVADFLFVWNVFRFFRLKNIRRSKSEYTANSYTMIKSYLLIGFRNAVRNGATSLINVLGLAVGVAVTITVFIFADQFFHTDGFQQKKDRIYEITNAVDTGRKLTTFSKVPYLLAPAIKDEVPGVEEFVRITMRSGALRFSDKVFYESFYFVDNSFSRVFNFPVLEGNLQSLSSPKCIVFTKLMANKYFGDQVAVGQTISIKFTNGHSEEFVVGALIDPPPNNTMYFDFLLSMEMYDKVFPADQYTWSDLSDATFLLMKPGHSIDEVQALTDKYKILQNESSPEWKTSDFKFYPFTELATRSYEIENGPVGSGEPQGVIALGSVALMLLLLACFNYMNISLATVSKRLKEIGIRKVVGGRKQEIVQQFIVENFLLCLISIMIGLVVAYSMFVPWLGTLVSNKIPFSFSSAYLPILFFLGLIIFIVLISGLYPAIYISRFQPVTILKGKEKFGQRSKLSRVLLTLQFILAFTTIVGCFVYIDNNLYLKNKDWGYDHKQNIFVPISDFSQFTNLSNKFSSQVNVINTAGTVDHIGRHRSTLPFQNEGQTFEAVIYRVGFEYLETMNLRLSEGRFFDKAIQSDQIESVVVNENFVRAMGWDNPINKIFKQDSIQRQVIGVVKNFHYTDFYREVLPVMFTITPESSFRYLALKVNEGSVEETETLLKSTWKEIAPDDPYNGMLQDDVFSNWANNSRTEMKLMVFVVIITVMLACLGLFGLVSYNITRRLKEFSVRKVFGAGSFHIFKLMNRDYIWILSIAFVLGAPAGLYLMDILIHQTYVDPQPAGWEPFIISVSLMLLTVAITIGSQMKRILNENPVTTLRSE